VRATEFGRTPGAVCNKWASYMGQSTGSQRTPRPLGAQVVVDVPRTAPEVAVFHQQPMQKSLERILFIWGIRRAARTPRSPCTQCFLFRKQQYKNIYNNHN